MPLNEIAGVDDKPLQDVADLIARSHKILVITGAGISTSCGIPDFRSKDGLYNLIPEQSFLLTPPPSAPSTPSRKRKAYTTDDDPTPPSSQSSVASTGSRRSSGATSKLRGQDLFDARVWKNSATTATFYQFIASLRQKIYSDVKETSPTHKFIRTLRDSGRLMRCYTQNIDGFEARDDLCMDLLRGKGNKRRFMKKTFEAPLPQNTLNTDFDGGCEVVPLHGDLEKLRCTLCQQTCEWSEEATEEFVEGRAPECEICSSKSDKRQANGKRGLSVGSLRPNIVLYGEEHPSNVLLAPLVPFDISSGPEALIIMGTSLKVFGLQKVVRDFAKAVHSKNGKGRVIFVNRTRPAESVWEGIIDDYIAMDCDDWVQDLNERRPDLSLRQSAIDRKVTKPIVKRKRSGDEQGEKPSKKAKIVVEIPKTPKMGQTAKKTSKKPKTADLKLLEVLQNLENSSSLPPDPASMPDNAKEMSRTWKVDKTNYPGRDLLSPLVQLRRPTASPIWRPSLAEGMSHTNWKSQPVLRSPLGPRTNGVSSPIAPAFSPITPNTPVKRMRAIWGEVSQQDNDENSGAESEFEIAESDREQEKENSSIDGTANTEGGDDAMSSQPASSWLSRLGQIGKSTRTGLFRQLVRANESG